MLPYLHEVYHKVDKFMLEHVFTMEVGDQKANIIALHNTQLNKRINK